MTEEESRRFGLINRLARVEAEWGPWKSDIETAERAVMELEVVLQVQEDVVAEWRDKIEFLEDVYARFESVVEHFERVWRGRKPRDPRDTLEQFFDLRDQLDKHDKRLCDAASERARVTFQDLCDLLTDVRARFDDDMTAWMPRKGE
jgi:hypothetical protein